MFGERRQTAPVDGEDYKVYFEGYWTYIGPRATTISVSSINSLKVPDGVNAAPAYSTFTCNSVEINGKIAYTVKRRAVCVNPFMCVLPKATAGSTGSAASLQFTRMSCRTFKIYGTVELTLYAYQVRFQPRIHRFQLFFR